MTPIKFAGATHNYGAPMGWDEATHGKCLTLPVKVDEARRILSVWELTPLERLQIARGDNVTLICLDVQPPVILGVAPLHEKLERPPFVQRHCVELSKETLSKPRYSSKAPETEVSGCNFVDEDGLFDEEALGEPTAHDNIYMSRETAVHGLYRHARAGR